MVKISEKYIAIAMLKLLENEKSVVEGGGASSVAAILSGSLPELAGKKYMILLRRYLTLLLDTKVSFL